MLITKTRFGGFLMPLCFVVFTSLKVTAQKSRINNIGQAIERFINKKKVIDFFSKEYNHQNDSLLIIVDLQNILNGYTITKWRGMKTEILRDGELLDSLGQFDANYLLRNRCNIYVLHSRVEIHKIIIVTIQHACTNVVSTVTITEKNKQFYLGKIENAAW